MQTVQCETLQPRWGSLCVVAATGESFTKEVAKQIEGHHVIAVKQAWQRVPWADVLYCLDAYWWRLVRDKIKDFQGEKWASWDPTFSQNQDVILEYKLHAIRGSMELGFSTNPSVIHYGRNTGFQAVNMALHLLRGPVKKVVLVGFDFKGGYFYGVHPRGPNHGRRWRDWIPQYEYAAKHLPESVQIINTSPDSLLKCFSNLTLEEALTE